MAGLAVLVLIPNLAAAWATVSNIVADGYAYDWVTFTRAAERLSSGDMYDFGGSFGFRWSPVAAWLLVVITPMGLTAWRLAHIAALALLRDWRIIAVALLSYPFWFDVETGNINTFVLVAAISAIRGSKLGTGIYLLLFLLVPRPLAFPVAIWLLWQRPQ